MKRVRTLILLFVVVAAVVVLVLGEAQQVSHAPIMIHGDSHFQKSGQGVIGGTGSEADPYIIEGWQISGEATCIQIENTTKYFVVRDCILTGGGNGILIAHAQNGVIERCTVQSADQGSPGDDTYGTFGDGISLVECEDVTINGCTVEDCDGSGISLYGSTECVVQENHLVHNGASGIEVSRASTSCEILDNYIEGAGWNHSTQALVVCCESRDNYVSGNEFGANAHGDLNVDTAQNTVAEETVGAASEEGAAEEDVCTTVPLSGLYWQANYADEKPRTETNYAAVVQGTDGYGDYYAMQWKSPDDTDLGIGRPEQLNRAGVTGIRLSLSAPEPVTILSVNVLGDYCGRDWRYATADPIVVGPERQDYEFSTADFSNDPLMGCTDTLTDDALERIYTIILFPEDREGELRVYEVALCGDSQDEAAHVDEGSGTPEIPAFAIDPDVTQDSVVQIGEGPQQLSTDIKFYPNTRRAKPGDTVYWTLDLGSLEGPFTIVSEMDNDNSPEPLVRTADPSIEIPFEYSEGNVYIPYVEVTDASGSTRTIYTVNVLYVIPGWEASTRLGLTLPSASDPNGDVIKGAILRTIDTALLDTDIGRDYVEAQVARWAGDGFNLIVLSNPWTTQGSSTPVQLPIYANNPWPVYWTGTLSIGQLADLTRVLHQAGIRVCWRYEFVGHRDYDTSMRLNYAPTDMDLYFRYQTQIKPMLADAAQQAGAEMFCLDTENPAFPSDARAIEVIDEVRESFTGVVTVNQTAEPALRSLVNEACDIVYFSLGPVLFDSMKSQSPNELAKAFEVQLRSQCLPLLYRVDRPGMFDIFAGWDVTDPENPDNRNYQERSFTAILSVLAELDSPLMGLAYHEVVLSPGFDSMWDPVGWPVESVLEEYFTNRIPEQREAELEATPLPPEVVHEIEDFESRVVPNELWMSFVNVTSSMSVDSIRSAKGNGSLRVTTISENTPGAFAFYMLRNDYSAMQDWSTYSTLNFWMRSDGNPASLMVSIYDRDGDRYLAELTILNREDEWVLYSVPLANLVHPDWAETGNGSLDLHRVAAFSVMEKFNDDKDHVTWYDDIYLGGPLRWTTGANTSDGADSSVSDSDGDGVPDDEDYCPEWPGSPATNGC